MVLMSGGNIHGRMLVEAMVKAGVGPALVLNEEGSDRARKLSKFLVNDYDNPPALNALTDKIRSVPRCDGAEAVQVIAEVAPDYLVLGGYGIMREPILSLATPLNAHPGLLPEYRGLDPVLWSVSRRDPVGATVHVVTEGIDEGPILLRGELPWRGAKTLLQLRLQCMRWGAELLARFLREPGRYPPQQQDARRAAYHGAFPQADYAKAGANLRFYRAADGGNRFVPDA